MPTAVLTIWWIAIGLALVATLIAVVLLLRVLHRCAASVWEFSTGSYDAADPDAYTLSASDDPFPGEYIHAEDVKPVTPTNFQGELFSEQPQYPIAWIIANAAILGVVGLIVLAVAAAMIMAPKAAAPKKI